MNTLRQHLIFIEMHYTGVAFIVSIVYVLRGFYIHLVICMLE